MKDKELKSYLLKACVESSIEKKKEALAQWEQHVSIDDLEYDSMRLAPYLLYQISQNKLPCIHEKRLKVLYKFWWLKTNHLVDQLKIACDALNQHGILPVVLKGGSLMYYYPDPVLRPMSDIDLEVPFSDIEKTLSVLKNIGYTWKRKELKFIKYFPKAIFDFYHAIGLKHEKLGVEIDLHWRAGSLLSYGFTKKMMDNLIAHPSIESAKRPSLAYELCLTILHAVSSKNRDNLNWVIDVHILNQVADIPTWQTVYALAEEENKLGLLQEGILFLEANGIQIPIKFNTSLPNKPILLTQNKEFSELNNPLKICYKRYKNSVLIVKELFPEASYFKRCFHFTRLLSMQVLRFFILHKTYFD